MTTRGEQDPPGTMTAIRDLERTLSDTVEHRAFAATCRREARSEAERLMTEAQDRGARAAERARTEVRSIEETEIEAIEAAADDRIAALREWLSRERAALLAQMRAVVVGGTSDRPRA